MRPHRPSRLIGFVALTMGMPSPVSAAVTPTQPWWQKAVFYEIYPRSFADSDGDGVGDLPGIASRLEYLRELGVDAIWLTPCFPSPQVDFGYDVADYEAIDPTYGTLADLDRLVAGGKDRGIRIILDLVLNHTSDQHPWFLDSRQRLSRFHLGQGLAGVRLRPWLAAPSVAARAGAISLPAFGSIVAEVVAPTAASLNTTGAPR